LGGARTADFAVRVSSLAIGLTVLSGIVVSKLRRPFLSHRYFFIIVRLLPRRTKLTELDFTLLARAFPPCPGVASFPPDGLGFLPDHWHCISAPQYPATISRVIKAVKQSSELHDRH
jgi:REP element-mobilizing transposase RayT